MAEGRKMLITDATMRTARVEGDHLKFTLENGQVVDAGNVGNAASDASMAAILGAPGSASNSQVVSIMAARELEVRATDHGVIADGATDCTAALQALANSVAAAGGGTILLPRGTTMFRGVVLRSRVTLQGAGQHETILKLFPGVNSHAIRNYKSVDGVEANGKRVEIRDLTIDGSRGTSTDTSYNGIHFETNPITEAATNDISYDALNLVENVTVKGMRGKGVDSYNSTGESRYVNVTSENCNSNGFDTGFDSYYLLCTASHCWNDGFNIRRGSSTFVNCKSFFSGYSPLQSGPNSSGYAIKSGFAVTGSRLAVTGAVAQNNYGYGYWMQADGVVLIGVADGNNFRSAPASRAALAMSNCSGCTVNMSSVMSAKQFGETYFGRQGVALEHTGGGYNAIQMTHVRLSGSDPADFISKMSANTVVGTSAIQILSSAPDRPA